MCLEIENQLLSKATIKGSGYKNTPPNHFTNVCIRTFLVQLDDAVLADHLGAGPGGQVVGAGALHRYLRPLARLAGLERAPVELVVDAGAVVVTLVDEAWPV